MLHLVLLLSLTQSAPNEPSQLAWADFTGDELPDLAAVHPSGAISLYKNTGDGAFEEVTASSALKEIKGAVSIEWSDLDGDKDVDLLVTTRAGVRLFENDERRSLNEATPNSPLSTLNSPLTKVSLHDFDRDGLIDLELSTEREHSLWHNKGKWSFQQVRLQLPPSVSPRAEVIPEVLPPAQPAPGKAPAGEIAERDPNGGQAQATIGSNGTYLGGGGTFQASASAPICAGTIEDASQIGTGVCIPASSIPMAGHLYPLGTEFFIDPGGRVGIGTTTPGAKLELKEWNVLDESLVSFEATNGVGNTQDVLDLRMNVAHQNSQFIECEDLGTGESVFVVHSGGGVTAKGNANFGGNANFDGDGSFDGSLSALNLSVDGGVTASGANINGLLETSGLRVNSGGNQGHVLTSDRLGVGTWQPLPAPPTGTPGFLPLWDGAGELSDSVIHQDPNGVRVKGSTTLDGLTTINSSLQVQEDAVIDGLLELQSLRMASGAQPGFVLTSDPGGGATWQPAAGRGLDGSGTPQQLALFSGATTVSDSALTQVGDNVGLNTDSPASTLHIVGNEVQKSGSGSLASVLIAPDEDFMDGDSELIFAEDKFGVQGMKWRYDGGDGILNLQRLNQFGGPDARIFSVGSGGDTYISADLAVDGDSVIGGALEANTLRLPAGAAAGLFLTSDESGNAAWGAGPSDPSGSPGLLPLWNAKGALSDSMIAQGVNGVSVGGDAQITGQTTLNGFTVVQADAEFNGHVDMTNSLSIGGTTNLQGKVTIVDDLDVTGDTEILGELEVTGQVTTDSVFAKSGVIAWPTDSSAFLAMRSGSSFEAGLRLDTNQQVSLYNGIDAITVDSNGNVGVGTSPDMDRLSVAGTVDATGFRMTAGASTGDVMTSDANGNASWSALPGGGLSGSGAANTFALWNSTGGLSGSTISQGPSGELRVSGNAIIDGQLTTLDNATIGGLLETTEKLSVHSASGTNAELKLRNGNSWTGGIRQASNNRLSLFNGGSSSGTNRLTITENGSVGIGNNITTPNNLLSVYGTADIQANLELENSPDDSRGRIQFKSSQGALGPNDGGELFMYSDDTLLVDNNEADGSIKLRVNNDDNTSLLLNQTGDIMIGGASFNYLNEPDTSPPFASPYGNGVVITSDRHKTRLDLNNTRNANTGSYGNDGGDCEIRFMTDEVVHFSMGVNEHYVTGDNWAENFVISGPSAASNPPTGTPAKGEGGVGSNPFFTITQAGNVGIGTSTPSEELDVAGTIRTKYLEITAGADLVERFEGDSELITPGKLVAIDPENPKHIRLTTSAYDSTVLGVLSGAGGINHGIALGQEGVTTGDLPVAMVGRVYAECSTENGPIRPGDLLTSSSIPGVGMKATDTEASFGAVIGKALTGLDDENGLVLVIVNLQ